MAHDTHFLSRIERLESDHAELAMALYHDSELVRHILHEAGLPDAVDRVAISLDDPEQGPFIIVARDGGFVTCLGAGMRLGDDKPRVTRKRLDAISGRVERVRQAMEEAEQNIGHTRRLMQQVTRAGDRLSREQFDQLARLAPLLGGHYFRGLIHGIDVAAETHALLERARRLTAPRHAKALRLYWRAVWSMAHFTLLLTADGPGLLAGLFERLEAQIPEQASKRSELLPWTLTRLGLTSFSARGAWAASKLGRVLLPDLKQSWLAAETYNTSMSFGLGLIAIGLRHRRYRAEIGKVLARPSSPGDEELLVHLRGLLSASYEAACESSEHKRPVPEIAHALLEEHFAAKGQPHARVSDEMAAAFLLSIPVELHGVNPLLHLLNWLPWLVRAEARDFYPPAAEVTDDKWTRREGAVLVEARRKHDCPWGTPKVEPTGPRRKGPCPCGSGRKYKRCCGAQGAERVLDDPDAALALSDELVVVDREPRDR